MDACFDFYSGKSRDNKVLIHKSPDELKAEIQEEMPSRGMSYDEIIDVLNNKVGKYSIAQFDEKNFSFPDSGNAIPAIMADIYSKFINQNMIAVSRSAPIGTFIEIQLIEWLRKLIGYESKPLYQIGSLSEVSGMITSGGHMSNHIAIMSALNSTYPEIKNQGISSLDVQPAIILAGDISHYSFNSAIHHLGIGQDALLSAKINSDYTTDIKSVEELINNPPEGKKPFMVVCVAGNSRTTGIDNISELSKLCKKYGLWLHTDACHGGSLLFSSKYRKKFLTDIEQSNSVSLDPHKGLFSPYPCSFVMFKKRDTLAMFTRYEKEVRDGSAWDLGYITPFYGSRGFESLKLWLTIKAIGLDKLEQIINDRQNLARKISRLINNSGYFTLFNEMDFYRMVFVYYPSDIRKKVSSLELTSSQKEKIKYWIDHYTHLINNQLYESGDLCLDEFKLIDEGNFTGLNIQDRYVVMSVTNGNPKQTFSNVQKNLQLLFDICNYFKPELINKIESILNNTSSGQKPSNKKTYGPAGW